MEIKWAITDINGGSRLCYRNARKVHPKSDNFSILLTIMATRAQLRYRVSYSGARSAERSLAPGREGVARGVSINGGCLNRNRSVSSPRQHDLPKHATFDQRTRNIYISKAMDYSRPSLRYEYKISPCQARKKTSSDSLRMHPQSSKAAIAVLLGGLSVAAQIILPPVPRRLDGVPLAQHGHVLSEVNKGGPSLRRTCEPEGELRGSNRLCGESQLVEQGSPEMGVIMGPQSRDKLLTTSTTSDKDALASTMHNKHWKMRVRFQSRLTA